MCSVYGHTSVRNPAGSCFSLKLTSIERMEQPANPSSVFRLGGLCVVDFLQRDQFHIENFQRSDGGTDTCEYRAHPSVASAWTNVDHRKL